MKKLDRLFNPKTIAVIGASATEGSVGHDLFKNLALSKFKGKVIPVNPNRPDILGIKTVPSINDIKEKVDLVIIATPAATVPKIVEDCGKKQVGGIVIITAGFKEAGAEGIILWNQLLEAGKKYNIPIIGPNCLGYLRPDINLNASFAVKNPIAGKIAFISQSGALGTAMLDWAIEENVGFSYFISIGSMMDIGFTELLEYLEKDKNTESIMLYMESLDKAQEFLAIAKKITPKKPVIILKVGKTEAGASAAKSHTGSLAGNDLIYDVAFKDSNIIRINSIEEIFAFGNFLSKQSHNVGSNIAIITNAGGPGVIATDKLVELKGNLAKISDSTKQKLDKILPKYWSHGNPLDILGDANPDRYSQTLQICLEDKAIETILIILTPQAMTNPTEVANQISKIYKTNKNAKTVVATFIGGSEIKAGIKILEQNGIPCFETPENALGTIITLANNNPENNLEQQTKIKRNIFGKILNKQNIKSDIKTATKIINNIKSQNRKNLTETEAKELLSCYEIETLKNKLVKTQDGVDIACSQLKFPLALKILSPDILHKMDVGGVKLNINSVEEAKKAFDEIMQSVKKKAPTAKIEGIIIDEMFNKNYELLIGVKKDPIFGHAIVFGMGGTAVELYNDTKISLLPINNNQAIEMIQNTKIGTLISGYRNLKPVNIELIAKTICKVAKMIEDFPEIKEVDINPLAVDNSAETKIAALDAKIILE